MSQKQAVAMHRSKMDKFWARIFLGRCRALCSTSKLVLRNAGGKKFFLNLPTPNTKLAVGLYDVDYYMAGRLNQFKTFVQLSLYNC